MSLEPKVHLVGRVAVESDGRVVDEAQFPGRQGRLTFAYLVAEQGRAVPRDELAEALWGETPPASWDKALTGIVSKLRALLADQGIDGANTLTGAFGCYRLELPEGIWVDILAAATAVDDAEAALTAAELDRAKDAAEFAAAVLGQPFLPGEDGSWVAGKRRELAELRARALGVLTEASLRSGDAPDAVKWAEQTIALAPFRETGYRRLMEAHVAAGDGAEALRVYERCRRLLADELGAYPSPETESIYRRLLEAPGVGPVAATSTEAVLPGVTSPTTQKLEAHPHARPVANLPVPPNALIGRRRELAEIVERVRDEKVRLLTLTGPGGAGKTRLALQVAADVVGDFPDGVFFVALASLKDPNLVLPTVAQTLGLVDTGAVSLLRTIAEHVAGRRLLLVLDNFEHVVVAASSVAEFVGDGLGSKVLVTSRTPLRLSAEWEFPVPPLALPNPARPPDPGGLVAYDGVALFAERTRAVSPGFAITDANARAVAELCVRLDGLPLAIELAAARMKVLTPQALLARLEHRLDLLTGGARDLPARHQTLRATIDWSLNLLSAEEQALFMRLAVFNGGCTLGAAEAVCGREILDGLTTLVDDNLVRQETQPDGEPRYTMLETIRDAALERLEASGEADELRRRHAAYFAAVDERDVVDLRFGEPDWLVLERDLDNFRAALNELVACDDRASLVRLVFALRYVWWIRGYLNEGARRSDEAVELAAELSPLLQARAWECAASFACWQRADDRSDDLFRRALATYREVGDEAAAAFCLHELGWLAARRGDLDEAVALHEQATATFRDLGSRKQLAIALHNHGLVQLQRRNYAGAKELLEESLARSRELDSELWIGNTLLDLGILALIEHRHEDAAPLFVEGLELGVRIGWRVNVAFALSGIAALVAMRGRLAAAARVLGAAKAVADATGYRFEPYEDAVFSQSLAAIIERADEPAIAAALTEGKSMNESDAAAYAIAMVEADTGRSRFPGAHTRGDPSGRSG